MKITDYLSENLVIVGMKPTDKQNSIEMMVDHLIATGSLGSNRREVLIEKLLEREALSTTGIGHRVAIPHASGETIDDMLVVVGQLPDGVEFESIDGEPVNLIFMIIGSDRSPRTHLQLLAMIVRICKNRELVEKLIASVSNEEAFKLLSDSVGAA